MSRSPPLSTEVWCSDTKTGLQDLSIQFFGDVPDLVQPRQPMVLGTGRRTRKSATRFRDQFDAFFVPRVLHSGTRRSLDAAAAFIDDTGPHGRRPLRHATLPNLNKDWLNSTMTSGSGFK